MISSDSPSPEEAEKHLVRRFLDAEKPGYFVEVGANEPRSEVSQTWHLEQLGWRGLLIEPVDYLYRQLVPARPGSKVVQAACSSPEKTGEAELLIPKSDSGLAGALASLEEGLDHAAYDDYERQKVNVVTLNKLLETESQDHIDFLSIDVEGTELDVLKGFDIARYRPRLLLIEDRLVYLEKHLYLKRHGYKLVKRTGFNNWYIPGTEEFAMSHAKERARLFKKLYLSLLPRKLKECFKLKNLRPLARL